METALDRAGWVYIVRENATGNTAMVSLPAAYLSFCKSNCWAILSHCRLGPNASLTVWDSRESLPAAFTTWLWYGNVGVPLNGDGNTGVPRNSKGKTPGRVR